MEQSCSFLAPVFAAAIVQARSKAKRNLWNQIRVDSTKMPGHLQCAVLENIHTSITEVIGISFHKGYGGGGAVFKKSFLYRRYGYFLELHNTNCCTITAFNNGDKMLKTKCYSFFSFKLT